MHLPLLIFQIFVQHSVVVFEYPLCMAESATNNVKYYIEMTYVNMFMALSTIQSLFSVKNMMKTLKIKINLSIVLQPLYLYSTETIWI